MYLVFKTLSLMHFIYIVTLFSVSVSLFSSKTQKGLNVLISGNDYSYFHLGKQENLVLLGFPVVLTIILLQI